MKILQKKFNFISFIFSIGLGILFFVVPALANKSILPDNMQWTCYGTTSSGYAQASAIAKAFLEEYGTRIRLMPSGTATGRILPIKKGRAHIGYLATETYFSSEGMYEFASPEWGPQDIRAALAAPATFGVIVTEKSGIDTLYDLEGKRVTWVVGNPSHYAKMTGYLAFAGLTWEDVEKVEVPSYKAAWNSLKTGQADAMVGSATAGAAYELESSRYGIHYPPFSPDDKEGWKRLRQVLDFFTPYKETVGAGITKENPAHLTQYRYPIAAVYADADVEFVYNFVKAMDETYSLYKDATPVMPRWHISKSGVTPAEAPFHKGAIKYLKEKGIWTEEDQDWNDKRIVRAKKLQNAWVEFINGEKVSEMKEKEFEKAWLNERLDTLRE